MQYLEGSGAPVLYTGRTVLKGYTKLVVSGGARLACILVSNFGPQGNHLYNINDFPQSLQTNARIVLQLGHIRFGPNLSSSLCVTVAAIRPVQLS
jgi:hypothetical protein